MKAAWIAVIAMSVALFGCEKKKQSNDQPFASISFSSPEGVALSSPAACVKFSADGSLQSSGCYEADYPVTISGSSITVDGIVGGEGFKLKEDAKFQDEEVR